MTGRDGQQESLKREGEQMEGGLGIAGGSYTGRESRAKWMGAEDKRVF